MFEKQSGAAEMPSMHNRSFVRLITAMRRMLPMLAAGILVTVYVVSAIVTGQLLSKLMTSAVVGAFWTGLSIGFGVQITRGMLVFFPQLNPNRPIFGYWGEAIAIVMALISVGSVIGMVSANNLHVAVAFELSVLMAAGMGVEIFLLREVRFYTEMELFRNKKWWNELQDHFRGRRDFKRFMDKLQEEADADTMTSSTLEEGITPLPGRRGLARRYKDFDRIDTKKEAAAPGGSSTDPLDLSDPVRLNLEVATS